MRWNWQQPDWPEFRWRASRLAQAEERLLLDGGKFIGAVRHLSESEREVLAVEAMSDEALTTSRIEGEILDRASVQSSIRRELGLADSSDVAARPAERGIGEMMVDLFRHAAEPLSEATLFRWHRLIMRGRPDLRDVGRYRTHAEPMQVISGPIGRRRIHFEAPPSDAVAGEMRRFVDWFNESAPGGPSPLPALTRAGIAHLYFESIHPFEDGNGRLGRAISEMALTQGVGGAALTALAATILDRRRLYYDALERANQHNEITDWLAWFAGIALQSQQRLLAQVEFLIDKTRLLERLRDSMNPRQQAVLLRMLREGPSGFKGGLSAGNYVSIARTSAATATRDLAELVELGALTRSGERRHTRYHLPIPLRPTPPITIDNSGRVIVGSS